MPPRSDDPPPAAANSVPAEREAAFRREFRADIRYWIETNPRLALRLFDLVEAVLRDPFRGIGKPEPLRHGRSNIWSRRLTQEHRLVSLVERDRVVFLQGRYHYRA